MDAKPQRKGRIEYLKEGFIVHWDEHVMSVEVIDYHATVLRLAWKDVMALATVASGSQPPPAQKPRTKRDLPPEIR
jgi:hypothetical protein